MLNKFKFIDEFESVYLFYDNPKKVILVNKRVFEENFYWFNHCSIDIILSFLDTMEINHLIFE